MVPGIPFINRRRRHYAAVCQPGYLGGDAPAAVILCLPVKPAGQPRGFAVQTVAAVFRQYRLLTLSLNKKYLTISILMTNLIISDIY
ncbi:hypothetical protein AYY18_09930 [Morganella psychrotolerans]|uniref:Uncharacterized protein n=1 Tax=Morganella psychrotolerans TaxID=368603 RepID=A0A1B8H588_9GAMM|nr:hypothetical protein AYY18_09930 [Morganella psychrotolerans]